MDDDDDRDLAEDDFVFTTSSDGEEPIPPLPPTQVSSRPAIVRLNRPVTEEDIHKMAAYLVEKRHVLHLKSKNRLWAEFARRPEVCRKFIRLRYIVSFRISQNKTRRSCNGWKGAARTHESRESSIWSLSMTWPSK